MQEDKEVTFDALDQVKICAVLFEQMLGTMKFRLDGMKDSATNGFERGRCDRLPCIKGSSVQRCTLELSEVWSYTVLIRKNQLKI